MESSGNNFIKIIENNEVLELTFDQEKMGFDWQQSDTSMNTLANILDSTYEKFKIINKIGSGKRKIYQISVDERVYTVFFHAHVYEQKGVIRVITPKSAIIEKHFYDLKPLIILAEIPHQTKESEIINNSWLLVNPTETNGNKPLYYDLSNRYIIEARLQESLTSLKPITSYTNSVVAYNNSNISELFSEKNYSEIIKNISGRISDELGLQFKSLNDNMLVSVRVDKRKAYFIMDRKEANDVLKDAAGICQKCNNRTKSVTEYERKRELNVFFKSKLDLNLNNNKDNIVALCKNCKYTEAKKLEL